MDNCEGRRMGVFIVFVMPQFHFSSTSLKVDWLFSSRWGGACFLALFVAFCFRCIFQIYNICRLLCFVFVCARYTRQDMCFWLCIAVSLFSVKTDTLYFRNRSAAISFTFIYSSVNCGAFFLSLFSSFWFPSFPFPNAKLSHDYLTSFYFFTSPAGNITLLTEVFTFKPWLSFYKFALVFVTSRGSVFCDLIKYF